MDVLFALKVSPPKAEVSHRGNVIDFLHPVVHLREEGTFCLTEIELKTITGTSHLALCTMGTDVVIPLVHDRIMMDRTIVLGLGTTHLVPTETMTKDTALGPVTIIGPHSTMGHHRQEISA